MKVGFLEELMGGGGSGQSSKSNSDSESSSATDTAVSTGTQVLTTTQVSPIISPIISSPNSGFTATATQHTSYPGGISPFDMGPGTNDLRDIRDNRAIVPNSDSFDIRDYVPDQAMQYGSKIDLTPVYIVGGIIAAALLIPAMKKNKRGARRVY